MHRVFPSNRKKPASSRVFQFHQVYVGDSWEVVTPFMQVGTYPTRNFATFGPSELQPPFTRAYFWCHSIAILLNGTGQVSAPIHLLSNLQRLVFLINSRFSLFSDNSYKNKSYYFSRSYRTILPSSFHIITLNTCVYSTNLPVSVSGTVILNFYFISWKYKSKQKIHLKGKDLNILSNKNSH